MHSPPGESLINLGALASDKLFNLLDDSCKGIIAHYLLCRIWAGKLPGFSDTLRTTILYTKNIHIKTEYLINHCGLNYSVDTNNTTSATKEQLLENKKIWQKRLRIKAAANKDLAQAGHDLVTSAFVHI